MIRRYQSNFKQMNRQRKISASLASLKAAVFDAVPIYAKVKSSYLLSIFELRHLIVEDLILILPALLIMQTN